MPRPSRSAVAFCIAIVALAALMPGIGVLACALVEPQWILLPDEVVTALPIAVVAGGEQPLALLSLLPSRAPPVSGPDGSQETRSSGEAWQKSS